MNETLGSIKMIRRSFGECGEVNEYQLMSDDIDKLSQIVDARNGSTAFCIDTHDLYILHEGKWYKL